MMALQRNICTISILTLFFGSRVSGFVPTHSAPASRNKPWGLFSSTSMTSTNKAADVTIDDNDKALRHEYDDDHATPPPTTLRAPLKWIGPYPCLGLTFPNLATESQRERNVSGISLDFVVDTAANVNTINGQIAQLLKLNQTGQALPGVATSGPIAGDDLPTFMLGDVQLEGQAPDDDDDSGLFMTGLTASVLPVASPGSAGLLSLAFLQTFPGGVEFVWGTKMENGNVPSPAMTFYATTDNDANILQGRQRVVLDRIPVTQLPAVTVQINGVEMPALLDTGSPITVLNAQAAKVANVDTIDIIPAKKNKKGLFAGFAEQFQKAKAASEGNVLTIMGTAGRPVDLIKSRETIDLAIQGADDDDDDDGRQEEDSIISFGSGNVFVGDLPGLAALKGLGVDSPPAVVLGMDFLRNRPQMLLRAQQNEVWF